MVNKEPKGKTEEFTFPISGAGLIKIMCDICGAEEGTIPHEKVVSQSVTALVKLCDSCTLNPWKLFHRRTDKR